jgi:hypothetical protein
LYELNLKDHSTVDALGAVLAASVVAKSVRLSSVLSTTNAATLTCTLQHALALVGPQGLVDLADGYSANGAHDLLVALGLDPRNCEKELSRDGLLCLKPNASIGDLIAKAVKDKKSTDEILRIISVRYCASE